MKIKNSKNLIIFQLFTLLFVSVFAACVSNPTDSKNLNRISWKQTTDQNGQKVPAIMLTQSRQILVGSEGGIFRSDDRGDSWKRVSDLLVWTFSVNQKGDIFAGTTEGVYFSNDNGDTWISGNIGFGISESDIWCFAINEEGMMYASVGNRGIFVSTDNGLSWFLRSEGLPKEPIQSLDINSIGHIFVGTSSQGIYRSANNGITWEPRSLPARSIEALKIHSDEEELIFVSTRFSGTSGGAVWRSGDNRGINWFQLSTNLVWTFTTTDDNKMVAATSDGLFLLTDRGDKWDRISNRFTGSVILALLLLSDGNIFAGTESSGLFRSTDNGVTWNQINLFKKN